MLVHVVRALEEAPDHGEGVLQSQRDDADGRADAVAAADPVPEAEDGLVADAEIPAAVHGGGDGDDVGGHDVGLRGGGARGGAEGANEPVSHGAGVEHRLGGGEGLGHHDDLRA